MVYVIIHCAIFGSPKKAECVTCVTLYEKKIFLSHNNEKQKQPPIEKLWLGFIPHPSRVHKTKETRRKNKKNEKNSTNIIEFHPTRKCSEYEKLMHNDGIFVFVYSTAEFGIFFER